MRYFSASRFLAIVAFLAASALAARADIVVSIQPVDRSPSFWFRFDAASGTAVPDESITYTSDYAVGRQPLYQTAIQFFNTSNGSIDFVYLDQIADELQEYGGPQLYSGPEGSPTFPDGVYSVTGLNGQAGAFLEVTTVPEPSTFALLGTGVLGVAGTFRRRLLRASSQEIPKAADGVCHCGLFVCADGAPPPLCSGGLALFCWV
jgi:hypothetical protein